MVQPDPMPGREDRLHSIGCAGRITQFSETEDGRYMITLCGISRFRILNESEGFQPYRRCDVSWDGFDRDLGKAETDPRFDRQLFPESAGPLFFRATMSTDWDNLQGCRGRIADQFAVDASGL